MYPHTNTNNINYFNGNTLKRSLVPDFLKQHNFSVNIIDGWADDRDIELAKCNIILNIHGKFHNIISRIFEHIRCNRLLEAGFNVLSEESLNLDSLFVSSYPNLKLIPYDDFFNIEQIIECYNNKLCTLHHNNYVLNILKNTHQRIDIPDEHIKFLELISKEFNPNNMIIYDNIYMIINTRKTD